MTEREHRPYHERRMDQQALDALLRIEELMTIVANNTRPSGTPARPIPNEAPQPPVETEDVFDPDGHKVGTVRKGKRR